MSLPPDFVRRALTGLAVAAVCFAGPWGCRDRTAAPPAPAARPLRVAIDQWPGYYPLVIADARGFLAEEGVTVSLRLPEDTHRMIAEFAARSHDVIAVSLGDIVLASRAQPEIRMVLCSDESAGGDQLLALAPLDPARLRGRRIGTTLGGFGELFVRRFLERHGLRPDEVQLVNADAASVPELLRRGEIDVGHTWEPYASAVRGAGGHVWYDSAATPGLILDGLITQTSVIRDREAELRGLLRAWFRAVDWWRAHEADGNALCEHRLGLPRGTVSLAGIRLLDRAANRRAFDPRAPAPSLHHTTRDYVEFFISRGALGRRVAPDDLLDGRFLE